MHGILTWVSAWLMPAAPERSVERVLEALRVDAGSVAAAALKVALVIVVAFGLQRVVRRVAHRIVQRARDGDPTTLTAREQRGHTIAQLLTDVGRIAIMVIAALLVLDIFINIGPLLAGAGILGVAFSLGAQTVVRDFITGLFILLEDQFIVGDRVVIGGIEGTVERITLRTVAVRDGTGALHFLANGSITAVTNLSRPSRAAGGAP